MEDPLPTKRQKVTPSLSCEVLYRPTILEQWTPEAFKRHNEVESEQKASKLPPKITLSPKRTVKFSVQPLKKFMESQHNCEQWWIVPDTEVLLLDRFLVNQLVKSDRTCRMLVPHMVLHDLAAMRDERQPEWMRIPARRLTEFLRDWVTAKVDVQTGIDAEYIVKNNTHASSDEVLNACLQLNKQNYYVVLLSEDPDRRQRAVQCNIPAYTIGQLQCMLTPSFRNYRYREWPITVTRTYSEAGNSGIA